MMKRIIFCAVLTILALGFAPAAAWAHDLQGDSITLDALNALDVTTDKTFSVTGDMTADDWEALKEYCGAEFKLVLVDETKIPMSALGDSNGTNVSIIQSIEANKVTEVANFAFAYCPNLIEAELPEATTIGTGAFGECVKPGQQHLNR